jgi:UDP:flavonoid glycosyltransferase YjiC (YdhE family)
VAGQHANVERLRRLGLCRVLKPEEWTAGNAARALRTVMSEFCRDVAHKWAGMVNREASLADACRYLEGL